MRQAALALALAAAALPALADEPELCARLRDVFAAAPEKFRSLATDEVWTSAESNRARVTLPHFDACYVDQIQPRFWCLTQSKVPRAAQTLAATVEREIAACYPAAAPKTEQRDAEPGVRQRIVRWTLGDGRGLNLRERRPQSATALGAVFLYVY